MLESLWRLVVQYITLVSHEIIRLREEDMKVEERASLIVSASLSVQMHAQFPYYHCGIQVWLCPGAGIRVPGQWTPNLRQRSEYSIGGVWEGGRGLSRMHKMEPCQ